MTLRAFRDGLIRHGTFPLVAFGPSLVTLALVAHETRITTPHLALAVALIAATYALIALCEHLLPHRSDWSHDLGDRATDVVYFVVFGPATALLSGTLAEAIVGALHAHVPTSLALAVWPTRWPLFLQLGLAAFVGELGHYAVHRAGHEWPALWRLHAIHHSARRLYWLNATRFHPIDLFLITFAQVLPLFVLGLPAPLYLAYVVASSCYGQLQHANVDVDARPYRFLFAIPELHRWHHSKNPREGDTNYGAILITVDQIFGTAFWPGRPITDPVGIGAMPSFPEGVGAQLLAPFRWSSIEHTEVTGRDEDEAEEHEGA